MCSYGKNNFPPPLEHYREKMQQAFISQPPVSASRVFEIIQKTWKLAQSIQVRRMICPACGQEDRNEFLDMKIASVEMNIDPIGNNI